MSSPEAHTPLLSLETLKLHMSITGDSKDTILSRYIVQATRQVFAWLSRTESELVTQFLLLLEDAGIDQPADGDITGNVVEQTVKDYLLWLEEQYSDVTREQLDIVSPFIGMIGDIEDACIILCKVYAQEEGKLGTAETFGVSSVAKSQGGTTTTVSYKDMRYEARKRVLPYRQWL